MQNHEIVCDQSTVDQLTNGQYKNLQKTFNDHMAVRQLAGDTQPTGFTMIF